jgi:hypothetical protein
MGQVFFRAGLFGVFALSLAALAQTTATLTGVTQVSNATTALRLLQCYRETTPATVVCDLQVTNTQPDQPLALTLSVAQVVAVVGAKATPAASLKAQEGKTALQTISMIVDPRTSKRFSANFNVPGNISSLNALRVGGFQFTDAAVAKTKPSAALSSVQVLDASQLNFAIGSYQFAFKGFIVDTYTTYANFEVVSTAAKEESLAASNISMRIFDSASAQYSSIRLKWSTQQSNTISVPPSVPFQLTIEFQGSPYSSQLYKNLSSSVTKYLELTVNGETRTFQNVDLRSLAR